MNKTNNEFKFKIDEFKKFSRNDKIAYLYNKKIFIKMLYKLHSSKPDRTLKNIFKSDQKCLFIKNFIFDYIDGFDFNLKFLIFNALISSL